MIRSIRRARRARRRSPASVRPLAPEQLEVAARDRHRRPQLVRDVVEEALLPGEQRARSRRAPRSRSQRVLAPPRVPDHRQEHRRHQRHLEQLAPELVPCERVARGSSRPWRRPRAASTIAVGRGAQTRKPYRSVRLIQMKWNGIVSQLGHAIIAATFAAANATQRLDRA